MNNKLRDFQRFIAGAVRGNKPAPPADDFEPEIRPYGVPAGQNKLELFECATCGRPPTRLEKSNLAAFLFEDVVSAKEYQISGMCQACQNKTFHREVWS